MNIKLTPLYSNYGPAEKLEFAKLIQSLMSLGYKRKLLYYTDGSVLMEKMDPQEIDMLQRLIKEQQHDPPST